MKFRGLPAVVLLCTGAAQAAAPPCGLAGDPVDTVESARYLVTYRTRPARITVGALFGLDLAVCPKAGAAPPETIRVDAHMPEHRHGMNYRPSVVARPDGRYEVSGLAFHMPGRWEFVFEVRGDGRLDRLTRSVVIE